MLINLAIFLLIIQNFFLNFHLSFICKNIFVAKKRYKYINKMNIDNDRFINMLFVYYH